MPIRITAAEIYRHDDCACEECDLLIPAKTLAVGEHHCCPRCGHTIAVHLPQQTIRPVAFGIAAIVMFALANCFPFMSFSSYGLTQEMTFIQAISMLVEADYLFLASVLSTTLIIIPLIFISSALLVFWRIDRGLHLYATRPLGRMLHHLRPWLMVDVFLIGVLISLVKLMSMAEIKMGLSFWAFIGYTLMLLKSITTVDPHWIWQRLYGTIPERKNLPQITAREAGLVGCTICGALHDQEAKHCQRCHKTLHSRHPGRLNHSWALLLTAAILYIPANTYSIMDTLFMGEVAPSTILEGVFILWRMGSYPIAAVIFIASVVVPLMKILALFWLCLQVQLKRRGNELRKLKLYRITEFVGRWSMIDVFVVAILAGLIRLENIMTIFPGPAAVSFAVVVLVTMVAAMCFDPRLIWDLQLKEEDDDLERA